MGPRGTLPNFPEIVENPRETIFWWVWGETGSPKGLRDTMQSICVVGTPLVSNLKTIPPQSQDCPTPIVGHKASPGQISKSQVHFLNPWSENRPPGPKTKKETHRQTMPSPGIGIDNGAIWCKLWRKAISGKPGSMFIVQAMEICNICIMFSKINRF